MVSNMPDWIFFHKKNSTKRKISLRLQCGKNVPAMEYEKLFRTGMKMGSTRKRILSGKHL